jgi:FkbM family methyltransferase
VSVRARITLRGKLAWWRVLRTIRRRVTVQTKHGRFVVDTGDGIIGKFLFLYGEYQHDLASRALPFLRQQGLIPERGRGVVLDIGANIGVISIGLLVNGELSEAVGIEPAPDNFALLERNVRENGLAGRYTSLMIAVSDRTGDLECALSPDNFGDHRVQRSGNVTERRVVSVPGRQLDGIVATLPASTAADITLVWIDVQGHEGHVFVGGREIFQRNIPVICELWPHGILQSGMTLEQFTVEAQRYWASFWVWRRAEKFVQYPITFLPKFLEELGDEAHDDVIFTRT